MAPSPEKPTVRGRDWYKELGKESIRDFSGEMFDRRQEFYRLRAEFKLGVGNVDDVLRDPKNKGYKTFEELQAMKGHTFEVAKEKYERGKGERLVDRLKTVFRQQFESEGLTGTELDKKTDQEVYLTLYYLARYGRAREGSRRRVHVDLLRRGETVEIRDGRLFIYKTDADGNKKYRVEGALLRGVPPTRKEREGKTFRPVPPKKEKLRPKGREEAMRTELPEELKPEFDQLAAAPQTQALLAALGNNRASREIEGRIRNLIQGIAAEDDPARKETLRKEALQQVERMGIPLETGLMERYKLSAAAEKFLASISLEGKMAMDEAYPGRYFFEHTVGGEMKGRYWITYASVGYELRDADKDGDASYVLNFLDGMNRKTLQATEIRKAIEKYEANGKQPLNSL